MDKYEILNDWYGTYIPWVYAVEHSYMSIKDIRNLIDDYKRMSYWWTSEEFRFKVECKIEFLTEVKSIFLVRSNAFKDMKSCGYDNIHETSAYYGRDTSIDFYDDYINDYVSLHRNFTYDDQCGGLVEPIPVSEYQWKYAWEETKRDTVYLDDTLFAKARNLCILDDVHSLIKKALERHSKFLKEHIHDECNDYNDIKVDTSSGPTFHHIKFVEEPPKINTVKEIPKQAAQVKPKPNIIPVTNSKVKQSKSKKTFEEKVVDILKENDGIKAVEIAVKLKCCQKDINRLLYGSLKRRVYRDFSFRWYIFK